MKTNINPSQYRYTFKLPYNDEVKALIKDLRSRGKRLGYTIRLRGSGPRAKLARKHFNGNSRGYDQSIPLKYAETVRIYISPKKG